MDKERIRALCIIAITQSGVSRRFWDVVNFSRYDWVLQLQTGDDLLAEETRPVEILSRMTDDEIIELFKQQILVAVAAGVPA